jgi:hypothetical protein
MKSKKMKTRKTRKLKTKKMKTKTKTKKMKSIGGSLKKRIEKSIGYVNSFKEYFEKEEDNHLLKDPKITELLDITKILSASLENVIKDIDVLDVTTKIQIYEKVIPTISFFKQLSENKLNRQKTKLKIATYKNFPPIVGFKNLNEKEIAYGFEVELLKLIFDTNFLKNYEVDLCLEFVKIDHYDKLWQLPNDCNLAIGGFSKTEQREQQIKQDQDNGTLTKNIYWSIPYYHVQRTLIYKKNDAAMVDLAQQFVEAFKRGDRELNSVMHNAPPSSIFIATALSTGYYDAILRLGRTHDDITNNRNNTNPKIEFGTTNEEDIRRLKTEPNVRGLMRGSDVATEIVKHDPDQSLAMITPWNIHNGIVYNYGIKDESNEGFSITCDDINLMLFINLRIIQLFQSGKIEELTERMFDGEFDFNKVIPNVESNCEENVKLDDVFEVKNQALKSEITATDKWIMQPYFDLMDTDQDGRISEREFQQYLKKKSDFTNYDNIAIHRLLQEADLNKDGFIDLNEFIAIMKLNSGKSNDWDILFKHIKEEYNS